MTDGHRCLFEDAIAKRTPTLEFLFMTAVRALERCGSVAKCIKKNVPEDVSKNMLMANILRDDDDERDTGANTDEDETAGD